MTLMPEQRRIERALALLNRGNDSEARAIIARAVYYVSNPALDRIHSYKLTKAEKDEAAKLVRAIDRIEHLLSGGKSGPLLRSVLHLVRLVGAEAGDETTWLPKLRELRGTLASYPNSGQTFLFEPGLGLARERIPTAPKRRRSKNRPGAQEDFGQKRIAAKQAAQLMRLFSVPIKLTRAGTYCKLAAVLYGDEQASIYSHCRAIVSGSNLR